MNWFTHTDKWTEVSCTEFEHIMKEYDYARTGWSDGISYYGARTGQSLGFVMDGGGSKAHGIFNTTVSKPERYFIRRELADV